MNAQPLLARRVAAVSQPPAAAAEKASAPMPVGPVVGASRVVAPSGRNEAANGRAPDSTEEDSVQPPFEESAEVSAEPVAAAEPPTWPDEAAESAFLADARERGEPVKATRAAAELAEDAVDPKALPKLDDLVNRIPAEVRDVLEDLFRAKFVKVQRVPKRALKS